jgi:hypothetical protein
MILLFVTFILGLLSPLIVVIYLIMSMRTD